MPAPLDLLPSLLSGLLVTLEVTVGGTRYVGPVIETPLSGAQSFA